MSTDAERLRRSKRNKFYLDVSSLSTQKDRRRTQPSPLSNGLSHLVRAHSLSPSDTGPSSASSLPDDEKRSRRPIRNNNYVYEDDSDEDEDSMRGVGMIGSHTCSKCPSRFETRPGLANHFKLHGVLNRKFKCEQCDFSCGSAKAIRNHRKCHGKSTKELSPSVAHSDTRSDTSECSRTPPELTPHKGVLPLLNGSGSPPELSAILPGNGLTGEEKKVNDARRHKCPECPFASRNRRRFQMHFLGHSKTTGFRCHRCSLTTPSSGFLKRHITEVHKETSFPWPPKHLVDGQERVLTPIGVATNGALPIGPVDQLKLSRKNKSRGKLFPRAFVHDKSGLRCPVPGCYHLCYTKCQMVSHKLRQHRVKSRQCSFRCTRCGANFRTRGALRVHRARRHRVRRIHPKAKSLLMKESLGRHFLAAVCSDLMSRSSSALQGDPALDDSPTSSGKATPLPQAASNLATPISQQLTNGVTTPVKDGSQTTIDASSLFGIELPEYLRAVVAEAVDLGDSAKNADASFRCDECPFVTNARSKLDRHMAKHTVRSDLDCPLCSFSCRGDDIMQQHFRLHVVLMHKQRAEAEKITAQLTSVITLETVTVAGKTTPPPPVSSQPSPVPSRARVTAARKKNDLTYTKVVMSDGTKMRRCLECPYVTKHSCDLSTHYQMHLTTGQRYKCTQCSYSTKRSVCLRTHYQHHREQNAKESTSRPLPLNFNGASIGRRQGAGRFRIYSCGTCPFVSRTLVGLWKHARYHLFRRGAVIRCSACEYYGIRMESLEDHLLLHNSDDVTVERLASAREDKTPPQRFLCDECPFVSSTYQQNWNHKQKHKRPNRYACKYCTFKIGSEIGLRDHMAVHGVDPSSVSRSGISDATATRILSRATRSANDLSRYAAIAAIKAESPSPVSKSESASTSQSSADVEIRPRPFEFGRPTQKRNLVYDGPLRLDVLDQLKQPPELISLLKREVKAEDAGQCPDCPFLDEDPLLFRIHRESHGANLPQKCDLCDYSCLTPENLHHHISLHLPMLSPNSAAAERRSSAHRRRYQQAESIPTGAPHFACSKCNFRTMTNDTFLEHMRWHAQDLQRRLVTTIKRASMQADEGRRIKAVRRTPKKADKFHSCTVCSFRCETLPAFSRHSEMHSLNGLYSCRICTYSANTKSIVDFHEMNHHFDHSLINLKKNAILAPDANKQQDEVDVAKLQKLAGRVFRCKRCEDFICYEISVFHRHWEQVHNETEQDRLDGLYLSLNMVPAESVTNVA